MWVMGDPKSGCLTGLQGVQDRASHGSQSLPVSRQPAVAPRVSLALWLFLHPLGEDDLEWPRGS